MKNKPPFGGLFYFWLTKSSLMIEGGIVSVQGGGGSALFLCLKKRGGRMKK